MSVFVDSSVVVAILNEEPEASDLEERLERAGGAAFVSALVRYESTLSLARALADRGGLRVDADLIRKSRQIVDELLAEIGAEDISITREIGDAAVETAMRYGKAVRHPADLNFGDCFSYACAKAANADLLYKGDDFRKTDLA